MTIIIEYNDRRTRYWQFLVLVRFHLDSPANELRRQSFPKEIFGRYVIGISDAIVRNGTYDHYTYILSFHIIAQLP